MRRFRRTAFTALAYVDGGGACSTTSGSAASRACRSATNDAASASVSRRPEGACQPIGGPSNWKLPTVNSTVSMPNAGASAQRVARSPWIHEAPRSTGTPSSSSVQVRPPMRSRASSTTTRCPPARALGQRRDRTPRPHHHDVVSVHQCPPVSGRRQPRREARPAGQCFLAVRQVGRHEPGVRPRKRKGLGLPVRRSVVHPRERGQGDETPRTRSASVLPARFVVERPSPTYPPAVPT